MTIENLVCSLESAKRLKELGAKQVSLFYWINTYNGEAVINHALHREPTSLGTLYAISETFQRINHASAFTVGELGEMLPCFIYKNGSGSLMCTKHPNSYKISYGIGEDWIQKEAETEAEVRALMLIHLLENNLIKV